MKIKLIAYCLLMSSMLQGMENQDDGMQTYEQLNSAFKCLFNSKNPVGTVISICSPYDYMRLACQKEIGNIIKKSPPMQAQHIVMVTNEVKGMHIDIRRLNRQKWLMNEIDTNLDKIYNYTDPMSSNYATVYNILSANKHLNYVSPESHIEWITDFMAKKGDIPFVINIQYQDLTKDPIVANIIQHLGITVPIFTNTLKPMFEAASQNNLPFQQCFVTENTTDAFYQLVTNDFIPLNKSENKYLNTLIFCTDQNRNIITHQYNKTTPLIKLLNDTNDETLKETPMAVFYITQLDDLTHHETTLNALKKYKKPIIIVIPDKITTDSLNQINAKLQTLGLRTEEKSITPSTLSTIKIDAQTNEQKVENSGEEVNKKIAPTTTTTKATDSPKRITTEIVHRSNKWYLVGGLALAFFGFLYYKYAAK